MERTMIETRQRSWFGKMIKWLFFIFNIIMVLGLIAIFSGDSGSPPAGTSNSEAYEAGKAIGAGAAVFVWLVVWMIGDAILGALVLATRGKKIIREVTS